MRCSLMSHFVDGALYIVVYHLTAEFWFQGEGASWEEVGAGWGGGTFRTKMSCALNVREGREHRYKPFTYKYQCLGYPDGQWPCSAII